MANENTNGSIRIEYSDDGTTVIFNNLTGEKIAEFNNNALQIASSDTAQVAGHNIIFLSSDKNYLDYAGLQLYTTKIKEYLAKADDRVNNRSIKTVIVDGDIIKFYKKENATLEDTADYEITLESEDISALKELLDGYSGKGAVANTVADVNASIKATNSEITELKNTIGDGFTSSTTVADSIDNLKDGIDALTSEKNITLTTAETPTKGYSKTYVLAQNNVAVGKVDIPEELVVKSGEVIIIDAEHATTELPAGTYIKLVIENQENPVYINVKDLVNVYTAQEDAAEIQLSIDNTSSPRVIKADIVNSSVTSDKLADNVVITDKIADSTVTKENVDSSLQTSLEKADSAVQYAEFKAAWYMPEGEVNEVSTSGDGVNITIRQDHELARTAFHLNKANIETVTEDDITNLFSEKVVNLWQKQKNI